MKKFRYAYPKSAYVVYALVNAVSIVSIVFASLRLAGVGGFISVIPATDILSIVLFALFFVALAILVFGTSYSFKGDDLVLDRFFVKKKISRENILRYVSDDAAGIGALYYADPATPEKVLYIVVSIHKKDRQAFVDALREFKPDVVIMANGEG
ncbi:MAG: hypothetical protein J6Y74_01125 [Clostridia bacterium]|nr:hypothetical protein [Clostridia bacterium]